MMPIHQKPKQKEYQVTMELVKMSTLYAGYIVEENSHFFPLGEGIPIKSKRR
jgi:hypothetical protein